MLRTSRLRNCIGPSHSPARSSAKEAVSGRSELAMASSYEGNWTIWTYTSGRSRSWVKVPRWAVRRPAVCAFHFSTSASTSSGRVVLNSMIWMNGMFISLAIPRQTPLIGNVNPRSMEINKLCRIRAEGTSEAVPLGPVEVPFNHAEEGVRAGGFGRTAPGGLQFQFREFALRPIRPAHVEGMCGHRVHDGSEDGDRHHPVEHR